MKFNVYSIWMDYYFYLYLILFFASTLIFLFAFKKLFVAEESVHSDAGLDDILSENEEKLQQIPQQDFIKENQTSPDVQPSLFSPPPTEQNHLSPAEEFIKNLYTAIDSINNRVKNIEKILNAKNKNANNEFILKFLEDIINDYDSLDKEKIKARLQFLISDLRKQ